MTGRYYIFCITHIQWTLGDQPDCIRQVRINQSKSTHWRDLHTIRAASCSTFCSILHTLTKSGWLWVTHIMMACYNTYNTRLKTRRTLHHEGLGNWPTGKIVSKNPKMVLPKEQERRNLVCVEKTISVWSQIALHCLCSQSHSWRLRYTTTVVHVHVVKLEKVAATAEEWWEECDKDLN